MGQRNNDQSRVFVKILRDAVPIILVPNEGMSSDSFFMSFAVEKPSNL